MDDVVIEEVGRDRLPEIVDLFNKIFRPQRTLEQFERRYIGRHNVLQMLATDEGKPVGFFLGFELKPDTFFAWFYGVLPECRRNGLGSQLIEAAHKWVKASGYPTMRLECYNTQRPMLHLAIELGYDIVGIRWDPSRTANLVIFEKKLNT
jgi:GNAT superfamily N-acetyltransferase